MAGRPPKALTLVEGHLTREQIAERQAAEKALAGGLRFAMSAVVKKNRVARKCFERLEEIYADLGICDAAFENVLNRYCVMLAEHEALLKRLAETNKACADLQKARAQMEAAEFIDRMNATVGAVIGLEKALGKKRDQLLAIEKENLLTAQSKLRAVPRKKTEKKPTGIAAYRAARGG